MGLRSSVPLQTSHESHSAFCAVRTICLPWLKWPGCGFDHPPPSSPSDRQRVELHLYHCSVFSWHVTGWNLPLPFYVIIHENGWSRIYHEVGGGVAVIQYILTPQKEVQLVVRMTTLDIPDSFLSVSSLSDLKQLLLDSSIRELMSIGRLHNWRVSCFGLNTISRGDHIVWLLLHPYYVHVECENLIFLTPKINIASSMNFLSLSILCE